MAIIEFASGEDDERVVGGSFDREHGVDVCRHTECRIQLHWYGADTGAECCDNWEHVGYGRGDGVGFVGQEHSASWWEDRERIDGLGFVDRDFLSTVQRGDIQRALHGDGGPSREHGPEPAELRCTNEQQFSSSECGDNGVDDGDVGWTEQRGS